MAKSGKNGPAAEGCLDHLFQIIDSRRGADPQESYTARLFAKGRLKMAKKIGEEATEVVIAALAEDKARLAAEIVWKRLVHSARRARSRRVIRNR